MPSSAVDGRVLRRDVGRRPLGDRRRHAADRRVRPVPARVGLPAGPSPGPSIIPTPIVRADLPIAFAMGATAVVGYNILFLYGVTLAPSTDGAIITPGLVPIFTAILVRLVYGERLARRGVVGLGLGLAGLVLVRRTGRRSAARSGSLGDLMFIGGALMWAIYTAHLAARDAATPSGPCHAAGHADRHAHAPATRRCSSEAGSRLLDASSRSLLSIAYLGVIGTAVAFATFSRGHPPDRLGEGRGVHRARAGPRRRAVRLAARRPDHAARDRRRDPGPRWAVAHPDRPRATSRRARRSARSSTRPRPDATSAGEVRRGTGG